MGIFNLASKKNGAQIAFGLNLSKEESAGGQIGAANVSTDQKGFQFGMFNSSRNQKGFQMGGFNHAKNDFHRIQFGLLNYIPENPPTLQVLPLINFRIG